MPIYKFHCSRCGKEVKQIVTYEDRLSTKCDCGSIMTVLLPDMGNDSIAVYDLVDKNRGKHVLRGVNKMMRDRAKAKNQEEVGEFVEKNGGMRAVTAGILDHNKKITIKEK